MTDEETVTITKTEYKEFLRAARELNALHAGGVDNWEYYSESLEENGYYEDEEA